MAEHSEDVFHHIRDFPYFELPRFLGGQTENLPVIPLGPYSLQLTKYMLLQVVAGLVVLLIFRGLSRRVAAGQPVKGRFWNFWETLAVFIRDEVARPAIGEGHHGHDDDEHHGMDLAGALQTGSLEHQDPHAHGAAAAGHHDSHGHAPASLADTGTHPADKYLPYIWSCFFYVLIANLLGAIPWLGSSTANISVTAALAFVTFIMVVVSGSRELGAVGFWKALVPSMDVPGLMGIFLLPMIWLIEFIGLIIKHGVLAVRLFANIMAGHTVIAVILAYIAQVAAPDVAAVYPWLFWVVAPASVFGQIAIGLLELFVAFLQAYIFAFLSALFIGAAVHPH